MAKVAIPIFRSRVAPVFDYCVRVSVFDIGHDRQTERNELYLGTLAPTGRVGALIKEGVTALICGGISDALEKMLQTSGISVIGGIAGQVDEVLKAFMSDRINEPQYCMPGIGVEKHPPPQKRYEHAPHGASTEGTKLSSHGEPLTGADVTSEAQSNLRILLVETDIDSQRTALHLLEKSGCDVDTVTDGREAIKALEKSQYDLVFMDAQMPEMDGYEATKVIRNPQSAVRSHQVPVIAMTPPASKEDLKRCIEAGMNDCIFKPIRPERLREIINVFLPPSQRDSHTR